MQCRRCECQKCRPTSSASGPALPPVRSRELEVPCCDSQRPESVAGREKPSGDCRATVTRYGSRCRCCAAATAPFPSANACEEQATMRMYCSSSWKDAENIDQPRMQGQDLRTPYIHTSTCLHSGATPRARLLTCAVSAMTSALVCAVSMLSVDKRLGREASSASVHSCGRAWAASTAAFAGLRKPRPSQSSSGLSCGKPRLRRMQPPCRAFAVGSRHHRSMLMMLQRLCLRLTF